MHCCCWCCYLTMAMYYSYGQRPLTYDIWWSYDNRERMWPKFPYICLMAAEKTLKNLNQEIDPTGDRTLAHCVRSNDVSPRPQRRSLQPMKVCLLALHLSHFINYRATVRGESSNPFNYQHGKYQQSILDFFTIMQHWQLIGEWYFAITIFPWSSACSSIECTVWFTVSGGGASLTFNQFTIKLTLFPLFDNVNL